MTAGSEPFQNEPTAELRRAAVRDALLASLAEVDARLPIEVPVLTGRERRFGSPFRSTDPAQPQRTVALATEATGDEVRTAVAAAATAGAEWASLGAGVRGEILMRGAQRMREDRNGLAALIVREAGKPWVDADAEVCEAIDFIEYYVRLADLLAAGRRLIEPPGERNELRYVPRGVVAVIAPWNFPVAISTGMAVAGLATGNGVVLKPAEQTPACALAIVETLRGAGVPEEALSLLPGGDAPGLALVEDPGVHAIAFTGSCQAGLAITRAAAVPALGQKHMKRVIAEMGGKNCILVDSDADLDEVIPAVCSSAFGFAGQKCSAASRLLVHEAIVEELAERLGGAVEALLVGRPEDFGVDLGPLIDEESMARFDRYLAEASCAGEVLASATLPTSSGYFRAPTVVVGQPSHSSVLSEEVFAPLLAMERVRDIDHACELVEESRFALTAGLFSRNPATVAAAERRLPVGNLYVNRGITGAVVGRQPFGGNRLSGTGSKAGGPDYLAAFVEPRVVSENMLRHGLVI
jgi:predicted delta-1-pyrroline-5-carboxylate dehydrogenase group 2